MEKPEEMIQYLCHLPDSPKTESIFMLEGWGGPEPIIHLQPNVLASLNERMAKQKGSFQKRLVEAVIDELIERGFFAKAKSEHEVTLAVNIISTFLKPEFYRKWAKA
jgi:hypothetical protein